ncbi:MAG: hypothetical protein MR639_14890 [Clostridium sp.]|uniref:hypothetical protein n=1 Tax=Clostridium sp. TaxID=1506 RepID=UPI002A856293|nr:hypothetical protein [Clostridium sp.]MDY5097477.1 hypothetical protein [Clostridium sp.]
MNTFIKFCALSTAKGMNVIIERIPLWATIVISVLGVIITHLLYKSKLNKSDLKLKRIKSKLNKTNLYKASQSNNTFQCLFEIIEGQGKRRIKQNTAS